MSAKKAYQSWAFSQKEERIKLLEKLYENYKKRWADIANAITLEMGAPKDFATKLQAGTGAAHIKSFIKHLKNFEAFLLIFIFSLILNLYSYATSMA